jgi:ATP synthase protein I
MVAATFVGAGIGWWLDNRFGTSPWLLAVFFLFGSGAGLVMVYRRFRNEAEDRK